MAASTAIKAAKNSGQYVPCGLAAPSESTTGRCHSPHSTPGSSAPGGQPNRACIRG